MAVRQFLMRAPLLSPQSRATLGVQLHDEVVSYVAPQPPADTHPELVLAAVIADRRRRDTIRLQRDAALRSRLIPPDPIDKLHPCPARSQAGSLRDLRRG